MDEERTMVLRMLKEGKISVEEADALLEELARGTGAEAGGEAGEAAEPAGREAGTGVRDRAGGPDVRRELRDIFQELVESIPRDVRRELSRARVAVTIPPFAEIMRGLRGLAEGRAEFAAEEAMRPGETLSLRQAWGDVRVRAVGEGPMRLRAVRRVWAAVPEDAQREAERLPVEVRREGSTVAVSVPPSEGRRVRVDFEITVPEGVTVRVDVAKGDVRLEGVAGAELRVLRGDVQATDLQGDLRVEVTSGDVALQDLAGPIAVATESGDVAVSRARSADLRITTLAGDVAVGLTELAEGAVTVETVSGDIELGLPPDGRAEIEASTRSGEVSTDLPLAARTADARSLRGTLNGPGAVVRLRATSGDIRIAGR